MGSSHSSQTKIIVSTKQDLIKENPSILKLKNCANIEKIGQYEVPIGEKFYGVRQVSGNGNSEIIMTILTEYECNKHEKIRQQIVNQHEIVPIWDTGDYDMFLKYSISPKGTCNLNEYLTYYEPNLEESLKIYSQIEKGLLKLHSMNIIHGNLKPENILFFEEDFTFKLFDFKYSVLDNQPSEFRHSNEYTAPEVLLASQIVDKSADLFSLGCILFKLLTRQPLRIKGETFAQMMIREKRRIGVGKYIDETTKEIMGLHSNLLEHLKALLSVTNPSEAGIPPPAVIKTALTFLERDRVETVKKKLEKYYDFLKKNNRTPKDARMTGDLEVDAQNLVCEDRLLNREFMSSIVNLKSNKVNCEPFLRVKLLISDLGNSPFMTKLMSYFSNADMGIVHTGLLIGEWKIEWVNSSTVSIRSEQIESDKTLAIIDIGEIRGAENVKQTFRKLTEIICKYNGSVQYHQFKANCQHFTSEVLSALNLQLPKSECFDKYFDNLRNGKVDRAFSKTLRDSNGPTTTSTFLKLCNNSTRPYVTSESYGVENENQEYDVQIPIESWRLSQAEFKGVEMAKKKIRVCLKEFNITPEKVGYSESLDLEAQRYVCEDRFMHFHFVRPTMKKNSRIVSNIPAVVRVKLLVSSLGKHELTKKAMATFAAILNVNNYGVVHTGILIGEWKIEWYDNSLVRVECDSDQKLDTNNTIAAIDIGEIAGADNVKKAFELITKISCNYNATKNYSLLGANCQHFVSDLLEALNLTLPVSESFKIYFDKLKRGETDRTFFVNENLATLFKTCNITNPYIGLKNITFENRKSLDEFCHFLEHIKYFDIEAGQSDFWLLKAFDRSFVLVGEDEICLTFDSTGVKENGFFTTNGGRDQDSITHIKYSVKDVDFSDCVLKR
ncbi:predicted protein [Naegleria gruberi]|uniref:Predicted protein n=1 Tax=Naegleria gruberi TaxID=5762 RepID=D2W575_NAEGR|nr:uncharacterized protein NAEGRDRAFT_54750 [Naegleria gruberi]EFC35779.1 predicted protein [Naegleria gruberi]|eukprot:XP_002668523.1 predicted protein [Naegleria gruberi strain NEG-M]